MKLKTTSWMFITAAVLLLFQFNLVSAVGEAAAETVAADSQQLAVTDEDSLQFEVLDARTDRAFLPDGRQAYRLYYADRNIYKDTAGKLKTRPLGWSLFNDEMKNAKLKKRNTGNYFYQMDFGSDKLIVNGGEMEKINSKLKQIGSAKTYKQNRGTEEIITEYTNVYEDIDIKFIDAGKMRVKEIVIKKRPADLNKSGDLIFWERISLPAEAKVFVGDEELKSEIISSGIIDIRLKNNNVISITPAIIYDNKNPESDYKENAAQKLKQIVKLTNRGRTVEIGLIVENSYLADPNNVYPLVIDPFYNVCQGTDKTCVTNFYLRYLTDQNTTNANLYMGYDYIESGNPCGPPNGHASRHTVLKFPISSSIPAGSTITSAKLRMYFAGSANCPPNYSGSVSMRPKMISSNTSWNDPASLTYSYVRGSLTYGGDSINISTSAANGTLYEWNLYTSMIQSWLNNSSANQGVLIEPAENWPSGFTPPTSWTSKERNFKFYSTRYTTDSAKWPYLYVETASPQPDLVIYSKTANKTTVAKGGTVEVSVRVKNQGTGETINSKIGYYYSSNNTCTLSDTYLDQDDVEPLWAGAVGNTDYATLTIPSSAAVGTGYLCFYADSLNWITESNENNNTDYLAITVTDPAKPDLTRSSDSLNKYSFLHGDSLYSNVTVKNQGNGSAGSTYIYYYFNKDFVSYSNYLGNQYIPSLGPGGVTTLDFSFDIQNDLTPGTYYLSYFIDGPGNIAESDENNNKFYFNAITISGQPDFQPSGFNIDNPGFKYSGLGETVSVSGQVKNFGTVNANNFAYGLDLINANGVYDLIGLSPATLSLNAGETKTVTLTGVIPSGLPYYGDYNVRIQLDPGNNFAESNENNNFNTTNNTVPVQAYYYGGGGGGGTTADYDSDGQKDVEEAAGGSDVSATDSKMFYDPQYRVYLASANDPKGADPVNIRTGALEYEETDFELPGRGLPIKFTRVYNSKLTERNARFGNGWSHSYNIFYYKDSATQNVEVYLGGALASIFTTTDGGNNYLPAKGEYDSLINEGGYLVYKTLTGIKYNFSLQLTDNMGWLQQIVDANNNVTQLNYATVRAVPLLSSIVDPSGRSINFVYPVSTDPQWDKIQEIRESISGAVRLVARYTYDVNNNLIQVHQENFYQTEPLQNIATYYSYNEGGLMDSATDARGTVLYNEYDGSGRVIKQYEYNLRIDASGAKRLIYEISYNDSADPTVPNSAHCTLTKNYREVGDYYSEKVCFNSDELKIYSERGANIEKWEYSSAGLPTKYIDADNNNYLYEYDGKRRLTKETLPDTAWRTINTFEYEDTFNRLVKKTETVSAVTSPAVPLEIKIANFAYDSFGNLTTAVDALNKVEKWEYNANGTIKKYTNKLNQAINYTYEPTGNYPDSESTTVIQADNTAQVIAKNYGYDVYGHRTSYTDPRNLTYAYKYDYRGNLRQETNPDGKSKYYTYDNEDHKISETDELGRVTNYTYDTDINASLLKIEKLGTGGPIVYQRQYDWLGNLKAEIDPLGVSATFAYDAANRLSAKTDPVKTINYEYYGNGKLKKETNTGGARSDYFYDARNNNIETRRYYDAANYVANKFEYDGFNRKTKEIDGRNYAATYAYDLLDRVALATDVLGNTTQYFYDANNNKIGEINPRAVIDPSLRNSLGHSNTYVYDGLNRLIKQFNADDKYTLNFYDANGNLLKTQDRKQNGDLLENFHLRQFDYDALNRQIKITDALGGMASSSYDAVGNVIGQKDQMGRVWNYIYDDFNRLTDENDPAGNNTHYTYDKAGNKKSVTDAQNKTTLFDYDSLNRLTKLTDPLGYWQEYGYDLLNNKTSVKDKRGFTTSYVYDKLNRLTDETNPQNTVINYTYDGNSNRLTENIAGKNTAYKYDELNRLEKRTEPGNKIFTFIYDENNNKTSEVNANNKTISYIYDKLDRLTKKTLPEGEVNYGYDQWDNLITLSDLSGTVNYTYDVLNRNTNETKTITGLSGKNYTTLREYFADSGLKSVTDVSNKKINYNYNNRGLLDNVAYSAGNLAVYTYASFGKPLTVTYGNGAITTYTYDELQRPKSVETKLGSNILFKQDYTYDKDSNRTQMVEYKLTDGQLTSSTVNYAYDSLNQLSGADYSHLPANRDLSYNYDAWGNRVSYHTAFGTSTYTYTAQTNEIAGLSLNNRLNIAYTTDNNGNITKEVYSLLGKNTKTIDYAWSSENRLNSITYQTPNQTTNSLNFAYDDFGNRVKKAVNPSAGSGQATTYYINNGLTVLNEVDATGNVVKTMINGLNPVAEIDKDNNILYVSQDILGSTVLITNNTGTIVHQYSYDPFGNIAGELGDEDKETKYLYTGQEFDPESDLYYYNARYYNPLLGRFLSKDPITHRNDGILGFNEYIYVKNNPLKYVDPTGEEGEKTNNTQEESWLGRAVRYMLGIETACAPGPGYTCPSQGSNDTFWSPGGPGETIGQFSDVADVFTVITGKNFDETNASFSDKMWAFGGIALPGLSGSGAKNIGKYIGKSFGKLGTVVEAEAGKIIGYTEHGFNQKITRSVPSSIINDTVKNPRVVLQQAGGTVLYLTDKAGVVLNKAGNIVTTYGKEFFKDPIKNVLNFFK